MKRSKTITRTRPVRPCSTSNHRGKAKTTQPWTTGEEITLRTTWCNAIDSYGHRRLHEKRSHYSGKKSPVGRQREKADVAGEIVGRWLPRAFGLVLSSTEFYSLRKLKKIDAKEVAVLPLNQNGNPNLSVSASQRSGGKIEDILLSDSSQDEVRTSVPDNQDVCTAATQVVMSSVGVVASSMQILTLSSNGFARKFYVAKAMGQLTLVGKVLPQTKGSRRPDLKSHSTRRHSMPNVENHCLLNFDKTIRNPRKVSSMETAISLIRRITSDIVLERINNIATVLFEPEIPREDETVQEVEYTENNEPPQTKRSLPSYMAATVSAKAKLRNQDFPETTTLNRRYSLPASINSKNFKLITNGFKTNSGRLKTRLDHFSCHEMEVACFAISFFSFVEGSGEHNTTVETGFVSGFLHCSVVGLFVV
ncbi:protein IQ-DOMAIN 31 [Tanacetum coccineum]